MKTRVAVVAALVLSPFAASASPGGYVYVAMPAAACAQASPCAPPQVLVFEGTAARLVAAIDLPVHTTPRGMVLSRDGAHLYVSNQGTAFGAATSLSVIDA